MKMRMAILFLLLNAVSFGQNKGSFFTTVLGGKNQLKSSGYMDTHILGSSGSDTTFYINSKSFSILPSAPRSDYQIIACDKQMNTLIVSELKNILVAPKKSQGLFYQKTLKTKSGFYILTYDGASVMLSMN